MLKRASLTSFALAVLGLLTLAKWFSIETWGRSTYEVAFQTISAIALLVVLAYGFWSVSVDWYVKWKDKNEH
ncbi:MAG: hypothetical protein ABJ320_18380 [Lentilitoribacter sp.]|uniref:hypothetical protein n=1 Tax=Tateyamaria sp. TaxID=1929288 RepID=UPI003271A5D1